MVRGNLKLMVLNTLKERELSGYGITKTLSDKFGWKPSAGSMYPLLDSLQKEGLLLSKKSGRKKMYSLTKTGKQELSKLLGQKTELIDELLSNIKMIDEIYGTKLLREPAKLMKKGK